MWTRTLTVKFKGKDTQVMVFLSDTTGDSQEIVTIQSMVNEYYLSETVAFTNRDAAYDFIKFFPSKAAISFLWRTAADAGALYN